MMILFIILPCNPIDTVGWYSMKTWQDKTQEKYIWMNKYEVDSTYYTEYISNTERLTKHKH